MPSGEGEDFATSMMAFKGTDGRGLEFNHRFYNLTTLDDHSTH